MKIKLALCVIMGLIINLSACNNAPKINDQIAYSSSEIKTSLYSGFNYEIDKEVFKRTDTKSQIGINIDYPQIKGINDIMIQTQINEQIKNTALKPYYEIFGDEENIDDGTEWSVEYSIVYISNSIISIKFEGSIFTKGNAHGINMIYAININLKTGREITLDELFDESFKKKLDNSVFKGIDVDTSNAEDTAMEEIFNRFKNDFMDNKNNFYFSLDKFVIILPVNNYFRFSTTYENLKDCMKLDNSLWSEVLKLNILE
ncbi:PdaC/SigV domain-containing protein [Lacrimispora brassicae]